LRDTKRKGEEQIPVNVRENPNTQADEDEDDGDLSYSVKLFVSRCCRSERVKNIAHKEGENGKRRASKSSENMSKNHHELFLRRSK